MDLVNEQRIEILNEQIQTEKDPQKVIALVDELARLLDDSRSKTDA
jgi:hypothetical protein